MKKLFLTLIILLFAATVQAQTATVTYDYSAAGAVPSVVQGYGATLYVNGVAFTMNDTCVATPAPALITCTANLPNISTALVPVGPNQFQVSMKDGILEGPKSVIPLVLTAPLAPSTPRIQ